MESEPPKSARTVKLHLSAMSGFCRFLMKQGCLKSNPVKLVTKPKVEKRLPHFFRKEQMNGFYESSKSVLEEDQINAFIAAPPLP